MRSFRALSPDSSIQRLRLPLHVVRGAAPGFRDAGNNGKNGALMNVGNNGFSWSSAVSGSNGVYLNFNATNLNPSNANSRAFGLQVRCLQAFIGDVTAGHKGMCNIPFRPLSGKDKVIHSSGVSCGRRLRIE